MFKKSFILTCAVSALGLTACSHNHNVDAVGGQFWQRINMSEAVYAQGPKAQQMLNRDISRCVTELRELERLGAVKDAIPTDFHGRVLDPDEKALYDWDTPERNKHLYAEQSTYLDFESCMSDKGWERVEHVPFDVARKGRENYLVAHTAYNYDPDGVASEQIDDGPYANQSVDEYPGGDYDHINE